MRTGIVSQFPPDLVEKVAVNGMFPVVVNTEILSDRIVLRVSARALNENCVAEVVRVGRALTVSVTGTVTVLGGRAVELIVTEPL